ncbi:FkbM family methyltransferase [Synechococcus sp. AH-736-G20]|nr:FkbM family methyltransferase [Synechococcus sp. AH-736-G20]
MIFHQLTKITTFVKNLLKPLVSGKIDLSSKRAFHPVDSRQIPCLSNILSYYLDDKAGRFIEVGAFDGVSLSNTYHVAASGWLGHCEPVKEYADKCKKNHLQYPLICVEEVCISDKYDEYIIINTAGVFSTVRPASNDHFLSQDLSKYYYNGGERISVQTTTLSMLIQNYSLRTIDPLLIDVE